MGKIVRIAGPTPAERAELASAVAGELATQGFECALVVDVGVPVEGWSGLCIMGPADARMQELVELVASQVEVVVDGREGAPRGVVVAKCSGGRLPEAVDTPAVKAVVGGQFEGARSFEPGDIQGLGLWLKEWLGEIPAERARIIVDGKRLPAKDFVQEIVAEAVVAMVGALKGGKGNRVVVAANR